MFTIRKAKQEDKESIYHVHAKAIRETCASHYSQEVIRIWVGRLQPEKYGVAISSNEFFVAEKDGSVVGFGELDPIGGEIAGLYVSPDASGRGVGWKLLCALEEKARALGLESLHLDSSLNAVSFYERAGFKSLEKRTKTLSPGVERASVRMFKELSQ
ncbi:MAG TPA: GNAT family N-acetyltransferase [Pyrinomonadaceae bacterium]